MRRKLRLLLALVVLLTGCKGLGGVASAMGHVAVGAAKATATVATVAARGVAVAGKAAAVAAPRVAGTVARAAAEVAVSVPVHIEPGPTVMDVGDPAYEPWHADYEAAAPRGDDPLEEELDLAGMILRSCVEPSGERVAGVFRIEIDGGVRFARLETGGGATEEACIVDTLRSLRFHPRTEATIVNFTLR